MNKHSFPEAMQASKWLQIQALLDSNEVAELLNSLAQVKFYALGRILSPDQLTITSKDFLENYQRYIDCLKSGKIPDFTEFRPLFSLALSASEDHLFSIQSEDGRQLLRIAKPVVQLQLHMMGYSKIENKFRPMILGKDSIHWGLQFSYPQLYMETSTNTVKNVLQGCNFPNTPIFQTIQKWIRTHTLPTPFLVDEKRVNVPMRLGMDCFKWINIHSQLENAGIKVLEKGDKRRED